MAAMSKRQITCGVKFIPGLATSRPLIRFLASEASSNKVVQRPSVRRGREVEQEKN